MTLTNWAGNVTFSAARVHRPTSVGQLQSLLTGATQVRALGTGHSFSQIANTTGDLVSVADLPPLLELDAEHARVRVGAGTRYGELVVALDAAGLALANLGSLPHISVAGACSTGTHGSGDANRVLAAAVSQLELVTASGDLVELSQEVDGERFAGSVVALGALGVVTALTLDLVPAFAVRQLVFDRMPLDALVEHLDEVMAAGYSVSVFTGWQTDDVDQVWVKQRVGWPSDGWPVDGWLGDGWPVDGWPVDGWLGDGWLGARAADGPRHPVPGADPSACTEQLGVPGPWYARLPHFRLEFTPSAGEELQSEYLLPREHARAAVEAVRDLRGLVAPLLQVCELRTVAADDLWLSPAYGRDSFAVHFTWVPDQAAVAAVLPVLEERLTALGARPHWGKVFATDVEGIRAAYPRLPDLARLATELDPAGVFRNAFLEPYLGG